jgi:hypothetical protein
MSVKNRVVDSCGAEAQGQLANLEEWECPVFITVTTRLVKT